MSLPIWKSKVLKLFLKKKKIVEINELKTAQRDVV